MARKKAAKSTKTITLRRRWRDQFTTALAKCGNVTEAATAAGIDRAVAYKARTKEEDFAARWDDAVQQGADAIEAALRTRAVNGVLKYVTHKGEIVTVPVDDEGNVLVETDPAAATAKRVPLVEREYSDTAAIFLLKGIRPDVYRERHHIKHDAEPGLRDPAAGADAIAAFLAELQSLAGCDPGTTPPSPNVP